MAASTQTITSQRESELLASVPTGLLINGQWRPAASGKTFDVEDPATGQVLLSIADAGAEDGAAALDAAAAAQESWAKRLRRASAGRSCAAPSSWSPSGPRTSRC